MEISFFWLFATVTTALTVLFFILRLQTPSDGARLEPGELGITQVGIQIKTLKTQPDTLHDGDIVLAVENQSMNDLLSGIFRFDPLKPEWQFGETLKYQILRDGTYKEVSVVLIDYPLLEILTRAWSTILFVLVTQITISLVFLLNPHETATRVLFVWAWSLSHTYVWALGLQVSDFTDGLSFWLFQVCTGILWFVFWGAFLHFIIVFPHEHSLVRKFPSLKIWAYLLPFLAAFLIIFLPGKAVNNLTWLVRLTASEWITAVGATLIWFIILIEGYWRRFSFAEKKRVRWIFFSGMVSAGLGAIFYLLPASIFRKPILPGHLMGFILLPFPISLAFSVIRHQLFDIDIIIRRSLLYSSLTVVLGLFYFAGILGLQEIFRRMTGKENQLAIVISTIAIVSIANPIRKWLQNVIDRRFYRRRYNAEQALAQLGTNIRKEVDIIHMTSHLANIVQETLQPMFMSIWLQKKVSEDSAMKDAWHMLLGLDNDGAEPFQQIGNLGAGRISENPEHHTEK